MSNYLQNLRQSFSKKSRSNRVRRSGARRGRTLTMESLEPRKMMAVTTLQNMSFAQNAGEKPQSKMFEYAGQWWTVMPNKSGTYVFRLDGTNWTQTYKVSTGKSFHADVKLVDNLAHVLLFDGTKS